jgi:hypothetical protein
MHTVDEQHETALDQGHFAARRMLAALLELEGDMERYAAAREGLEATFMPSMNTLEQAVASAKRNLKHWLKNG